MKNEKIKKKWRNSCYLNGNQWQTWKKKAKSLPNEYYMVSGQFINWLVQPRILVCAQIYLRKQKTISFKSKKKRVKRNTCEKWPIHSSTRWIIDKLCENIFRITRPLLLMFRFKLSVSLAYKHLTYSFTLPICVRAPNWTFYTLHYYAKKRKRVRARERISTRLCFSVYSLF